MSTGVDPDDIEFRDKWIKESNLSSVGADLLFNDCELSELMEFTDSDLEEFAREKDLKVIERKRLIKGIQRLKTSHELRSRRRSRKGSNASAQSNPVRDLIRRVSEDLPYGNHSGKPKHLPGSHSVTLSQSRPVSARAASSNTKARRTKKKGKQNSALSRANTMRSKSKKKKKGKHKQSNTLDPSSTSLLYTPSRDSGELMYDPLKKNGSVGSVPSSLSSNGSTGSSPKSAPSRGSHRSRSKSSTMSRLVMADPEPSPDRLIMVDPEEQIREAMERLNNNAIATRADITVQFKEFRDLLKKREEKLLEDVDATLEKKRRLLQSQLDYEQESGGTGTNALAADPAMMLEIEREQIQNTLTTLGWVHGATTDSAEQQQRQERERKRRRLAREQYQCVEKLKNITVHEKECSLKKEVSQRLTIEVQHEIRKINKRSAEVERQLDEARPLLEEAKALVSSIRKSDLDEIRALKNPPPVVELVMTSVVIVLGNKVESWRDIQKVLAGFKFVQSVLEFDTEKMKKKTRQEAVKYTKKGEFNEERANKASRCCGPLVRWVKSQIQYSEILDIVRPMKREIKKLEKKLQQKEKQLNTCVGLVQELERKIRQSRKEVDQMVEHMIKMQDDNDVGFEPGTAAEKISARMEGNSTRRRSLANGRE